MTVLNYNVGIPAASHNPSSDQPLMLQNYNALDTFLAVDHVGFKTSLRTTPGTVSGYHSTIHQVPRADIPLSIQNTMQIFSKADSNNKLQLFAKNAYSNVGTDLELFQLTGNSLSTNGYAWVGGVLIQWGRVTVALNTNPATTINLNTPPNIPFPTAIFEVILTPLSLNSAIGGSNNPLRLTWDQTISTSSSIAWAAATNAAVAGLYTGISWFAIGN